MRRGPADNMLSNRQTLFTKKYVYIIIFSGLLISSLFAVFPIQLTGAESYLELSTITPIPANESTGVLLPVTLNITLSGLEGTTANITWYANTSGSFVAFANDSEVSVDSGSISLERTNDNFTDYNTTYYWYFTYQNSSTYRSPMYWFTTESRIVWTKHTIIQNNIVTVYPADLDCDGDIDILAGRGEAGGNISWLNNTAGDGSVWTEHVIAPFFNHTRDVFPSDLDGDGDLDILGANGTVAHLSEVSWWQNNLSTNGEWTKTIIDRNDSLDYLISLCSADFNKDNTMDVLGASWRDDTIVWWKNNGSPQIENWENHTINASYDLPNGIFPIDIDTDGDLDVLATSPNLDTIRLWNNTNGLATAWQQHNVSTNFDLATQVTAVDINGDGAVDVLGTGATDSGNITWWEYNDTLGDWSSHVIFNSSRFSHAYGINTGDMDSDGDIDVLGTAYDDDTLSWFENTGAGVTWVNHTITSSLEKAIDATPVDIDGDGDLDVLALGNTTSLCWWENHLVPRISNVTMSPDPAYADDTIRCSYEYHGGRQGLSDFVWKVNNVNQIVTPSQQTDSFHKFEIHMITPSYLGNFVCTADIDTDGKIDVITTGVSENVTWWKNNELDGGSWTPTTLNPSDFGTNSVNACDLDRDGDLDIIAVEPSENITWWNNTAGNGTQWTKQPIATNFYEPTRVLTEDLDADGYIDILAVSSFSDNLSWWKNNLSDNGLWNEQIIASIDGGHDIDTADLDNDGDIDIIGVSYTDDTIAWWENNLTGDGSWNSKTITTSLEHPYRLATADLDQDGDIDIIAGAAVGGDLIWCENNLSGDAIWEVEYLEYNKPIRWIATADMDNDGDIDVIRANNSYSIVWYENSLPVPHNWLSYTIASQSSSPNLLGTRCLACADIDRDGYVDVIGTNDDGVYWFENKKQGTLLFHNGCFNASDKVRCEITPVNFDNQTRGAIRYGELNISNTRPTINQVYPADNARGIGLYPTNRVYVNDTDGDIEQIRFYNWDATDLEWRGNVHYITNNSPATFGGNTNHPDAESYSHNHSIINFLCGSWFVCPTNGTINGVQFTYLGTHSTGGNQNTNASCCLYFYNNSNPLEICHSSNLTDITAFDSMSPSSLNCDFVEGVNITAGQKYYILCWANTSTNIDRIDLYYDLATGINRSISIPWTFSETFPETLNLSSENVTYEENRLFKIIVQYTPDPLGANTYYMDNFNIDTYSTNYNWSVNITDSVQWTNQSYTFTTNYPPEITNPIPANQTNGVTINPTLSVTISDPDDSVQTMNLTWYYRNTTGTWQNFGTNTTCDNGSYSQHLTNLAYNTTYRWYVNVSDGITTNTSDIYTFNTSQIKITSPSPADDQTAIPRTLSQVSAQINHTAGTPMDWNITLSTGATDNGTAASNGAITCSLTTPLAYNTWYTWWVNVTDGTAWNNQTYQFRTVQQTTPQGSSPPPQTPDSPPTITDLTHLPYSPHATDMVTITANITDDDPLDTVILIWDDNNKHQSPMILQSNNSYTKQIGPFPEGTTIYYWINATDSANQTTTSETKQFTIPDTTPPTITIITPQNHSIIYNPRQPIKATYTDPSGINTTNIRLTLNNQNITNITIKTPNYIKYTPPYNLTPDNYTIYLHVPDIHGNTATKQWMFTLHSSPSVETNTIGNITQNTTNTIPLTNTQTTGLHTITITPQNNLNNVVITVAHVEKPDKTIPPPPNYLIYKYLDVTLTADDENIDDTSIQSAVFKFEVAKTWLNLNNFTTNNITMLKYHNTTWIKLNTTVLTIDNETYVYFQANTTSFSTFAIAGGQIKKVGQYESIEIPWQVILAVIIIASIILILILFKAGYIYTEEKKSGEKKK